MKRLLTRYSGFNSHVIHFSSFATPFFQIVVKQQEEEQRKSEEYFDEFEIWKVAEKNNEYERRLKTRLDLLIIGEFYSFVLSLLCS